MDYNKKLKELEEKTDKDFKSAVRLYFVTGSIFAVIIGLLIFIIINTITHQ